MALFRRLLIAMLSVVAALALSCQREEPLERLWPAPEFALVDQQGRPFGSVDLAGRATAMNFIYTNCTDTCPLLTATMAQVQDRLLKEGLLGSKVQLVSVTVDPRRDSPPVLAAYAARFRADPDAWRFLTGEPEQIYAALAGFKLNTVEVARASEGADVVPHSNRFLVLDADRQVRAALPGEDITPDEIVRTVRKVLP
ncbi:MAG TPA: SCO family protein [Chloroflexota bacterium]|nr:SCO family protein [Chloroflexota bacterium]